MNDVTTSVPKWFKTVAIIALVWNIFGAIAYIMQVTMGPEAYEALPDAERALYESIPTWATAAFAIAVWAGVLGAVGLVLKKSWSLPVLAVSLLGIIVQDIHAFFLSNTMEVMGAGSIIFPMVVLFFQLYLVYLAKTGRDKGWFE